MNILKSILNIFSGGIAEPIKAIDHLLDECNYSDEEKAKHLVVFEKIKQDSIGRQAIITMLDATHKNIFNSGWRPFLGWVCGLGFFYEIILRPIMLNFDIHLIGLDKVTIISMTVSLLGLSAERTIEKIRKVTR
jgi:hypothetical protein